MKIFGIAAVLLGSFILTGCSQKLYVPSQEQIVAAKVFLPEADSSLLVQGHNLYKNKCSGCHFLYRPETYTEKEWDKFIPEMKERSKLTETEFGQIRVYLLALSKKGPAR